MTERGHLVLVLHDSQLSMPGPRPISIGGLPVFERLAEDASARGFRFKNAADWIAEGQPGPAHLLWDFASHAVLPRSLRTPTVRSVVAWTMESPLVAHRGYHRLTAIARDANAVMTFPGARELLPAGTRFEALYWPNHDRRSLDDVSPRPRLLVLVNSNKRANAGIRDLPLREPVRAARLLAASALATSYRLRHSWTVEDLYDERLRAITELGGTGELDLYGVGWDRPIPGLAPDRQRIVDAIYRGPVADKRKLMSDYRFALVIENTRFPGYVTEKVFDALLAGAVPVYLGAPDLASLVPPDVFVDVTAFGDYAELVRHLQALSERDVGAMRDAGRAFLESAAFDRFTEADFVRRLLDLVIEIDDAQPRTSSS